MVLMQQLTTNMLDSSKELRRQIGPLTQIVVQNQVPSHDGIGSEDEVIMTGLS